MLTWTNKNALTEEFCKHVIDKFENDENRYVGRVGSGIDESMKVTTDLVVNPKNGWSEEDEIFCKSLDTNLKLYLEQLQRPLFPLRTGDLTDTGYQLQKYTPDGFYNWHDDYCFSEQNGSRVLTFIWYLNTVDEGGHTEFLNGEKINPEVGKILIFPATWTYVHRGCNPVNQDKYICTGWLYNNWTSNREV
jgi:hypothetical protein